MLHGSSSGALGPFLATQCHISPAARVDALLKIFKDHWIEDVATLKKCLPQLEKHLPAAAHQAIAAGLEQHDAAATAPPPNRLLQRSATADTLSTPATPTSSSSRRNSLASSGLFAMPMKLLPPVEEASPPIRGLAVNTQALQRNTLGAFDGSGGQPTEAFARQVKAYRKRLKRMYRCTMMPNSRFTRRWDALLVVALLFVATVTPFEVGFLSVDLNALFFVNRAIDVFFTFDIVLNFFIAYREEVDKGAGWVFDNKRIALNYLKTWFLLDLISAVPFDSLLLVLERLGVFNPGGIIGSWLRLTRLIKLLRIVRLGRIVARWQASIGLSYAITSLVQFLLLTLMMAHWLACLWGYVGRNSGDGILSADAPRDPLNQSWIELAGFVDLFDETGAHGTPLAGAFRLYGASLYVSLNNIFGGSCELHPANYVEYYAHCLMMLVGSSIWAFVIGSGCGIIATLNPERIEYRQTMDQVNYFAKSRRLPPHLTHKLRSFFHSTQHIFHAKRFDALLEKMSGTLRADICSHVARGVLAKVPYFNESDVESDFLASVALALKPRVYCPRELVRTDELVIVERGVCVRTGKIYVKGMCVGEDMIVSRPAFRDGAPAIALSFLQVSTLDRSSLDDLLVSYPRARKAVHKAAMRIATRRAFVTAAAHILATQRGGGEGAPQSTPGSSQRSSSRGRERVLLAVAPMQTMLAEREKESEESLEASRGGALARRLLDQWGGTDERLLFIERRTEEMTRLQQKFEAKVEEMGDGLREEIRAMARATAAALGGEAAVGVEGDAARGAEGKGGVAAVSAVAPPPDAAQAPPAVIRRRVNNLGRPSPVRRLAGRQPMGCGGAGGVSPPARASPTSATKGLAPSTRRAGRARVAPDEELVEKSEKAELLEA